MYTHLCEIKHIDQPVSHPIHVSQYLVEKYGRGKLLGQTDAERYTITGWLFWQMSALGPTFGQIFDTTYFVKPVNTVMLERMKAEANRQLGVMETALAKHKYLAGGEL